MAHDRNWQLKEICRIVLSHPPAERDRHLELMCGGDTEMLTAAREYISQSEASTMMESLPRCAVDEQFNQYRVESFLGAGGMGEVFRAHDTVLGREVAIKTLPVAWASDPERLNRLRQEARALASINH